MHVEMVDRLSSILAVVDHSAEAFIEDSLLTSHFPGYQQQMAKKLEPMNVAYLEARLMVLFIRIVTSCMLHLCWTFIKLNQPLFTYINLIYFIVNLSNYIFNKFLNLDKCQTMQFLCEPFTSDRPVKQLATR